MPDIVVKNQTELDAAIKSARGGDTILLASGTYTSITMSNINPTSGITVKSQDSTKPATVGTVWLTNSSNITLKGLNVVTPTKLANDGDTANRVMGSSNITIDGLRFSGGTGDPSESKGVGLIIRGGTNNKLINSSVDHFVKGIIVRGVDGMLVQGNNFHDNRMDHTNFAEMKNLVIDGNTFNGLYPIGGEHPDAIQFYTQSMSSGSSNVTIKNNVILQGDGLGTQGIFMGEENGNLPYNNVTIENNLVYLSGMYHGISVLNAQNVTVKSNTILSMPDEKSTWIRLEKVTGTVTNNVTDEIVLAGTNQITSSNNIQLASDPVMTRTIADLGKGAKATVYGLMLDGIGYAPVAGSAMAKDVAAQRAAALALPSAPKLLLDLNFSSAGGMIDTSGWSTDDPVKALTAGMISNDMLNVKTGSGVELGRGTSRQLYSLSAFTLNFDMKRSGVTAPAGQIMGIYKSWDISLRADGELVFTMTNDAGVTSSLVTRGAKLTDTATHKIALSYDSTRRSATLYVDGVSRGTATMSGSTRKQEFWGLYVGAPFSAAFSGAVGDIEIRDTAYSAAQILALNTSSVVTSPAKAADTLKVMVAKGVAESAATLAGSTAWSGAMSSPATLSLAGAFGTTAASQSPLAAALAGASAAGTQSAGTMSFSSLTASRFAALNLYHV
ncbi:right-handed parallel beta-helix repeat-containing protein [Sphingomonas pituitosa]|uniref:right-handed parallel beta-helix repeat-containing protein n=1 Tax=Sphingomonas pituitosa TaxID=99597 RepID=UPI000830D6E5|nr:right-handed parallel beta-helix repeat-containing protein [Sphingomonas pituitosa]